MLSSRTKKIEIKNQSIEDKMAVLNRISLHWLGPQWDYYRKIKKAGEGFQFLKEKGHLEQMKATQSALRFTSKTAKKSYRSIYQSCVKDINANLGIKKENFPELPEVVEGQDPPSLTSEFDSIIISWTPIKFFLPIKLIREKGKATQRHSEGLAAKLFFKVIAYYAVPENWDNRKLSLYLRKITKESSYQEVAAALEALKADLTAFNDVYEAFKFGKASLSKDKSQEEGSFDDAMGVESFESQVRTLYWHEFIYRGVEQFLFRYFLALVTATESTHVIRYLANIFSPLFQKAIDNKNVFLGSFETDRSKDRFRAPYQQFKEKRDNDPIKMQIKVAKKVYETYPYNLNLLSTSTIGFDLKEPPAIDSEWGDFISHRILGYEKSGGSAEQEEAVQTEIEELSPIEERLLEIEEELSQISVEARESALMMILSILITCTMHRRAARHNILDRLKKRSVSDKELATKRIGEIRKQAAKKIRQMESKVNKLKRMEQDEAVTVFEQDVEKFKKSVDLKCEQIQKYTVKDLQGQKKRVQDLLSSISKEDAINVSAAAKSVMELTQEIDPNGDFIDAFTKRATDSIQKEYTKELEPFYQYMFDVLEPSTQAKVAIIQSLQKTGGDEGVVLALNDDEAEENKKTLDGLKAKIEASLPGIFSGKFVFASASIPLEDLFNISIDNKSLQTMLSLKMVTSKNPKPNKLSGNIVKALLVLNMVQNPVPHNTIINEGKEEETDPLKAINTTVLNKLLSQL